MKLYYLSYKKGLTLVEIVVVLGIISILTAVLIPSVSYYLPSIQLNGISRELIGDLRLAQERAITEQNQHLIRFNPTAIPPTYQLIEINSGVEEVEKSNSLSNGQSLTLDATILNNQIVFSADGGPSSSGQIHILINSIQKDISVTPAGFINLQ